MSSWIYLASQSPRRSALLDQIGVAHQLLLPDPQEDAEELEVALPGETAKAYVQRVTRLKLLAAQQRLLRRELSRAPVLCADTTVALGRAIYAKPEDATDALRILQALSGRTHRVLTAVAIGAGDRILEAVSESRVTFASITAAQILAYIETGEPMGKAGAYAVQGHAAAWISHISGSYTGIMGLPLFETAALLRNLGQ
jgi:septum formation protein